jgi:hypothetical protein
MVAKRFIRLGSQLATLIDDALETGIIIKDETAPFRYTLSTHDVAALWNASRRTPDTTHSITSNIIALYFPYEYTRVKSGGIYHYPPLVLASAPLPAPSITARTRRHNPMACSPGIRAQIVQYVAQGHSLQEAAFLGGRLRALNDPRTPPSIIKAIEEDRQTPAPISVTTVRRYIAESTTPWVDPPRPRSEVIKKAWVARNRKSGDARSRHAWDAAHSPSTTPPPPASDSIWAKVRAPHNPDDPGSE